MGTSGKSPGIRNGKSKSKERGGSSALASPQNLAIIWPDMTYTIRLSREAVEDFRNLKANMRSVVRDAIEIHLRRQPARTSKSRIKRLRGLSSPQFRLRIGDVRVYYDVTETTVEILAIIPKSEADDWLVRAGEPQ